jgi:hypothetical protein
VSDIASAEVWARIGARGCATGRFGVAATAGEYAMQAGRRGGGAAEEGTAARTALAPAARMLAAGLVLGPEAVPRAIERCRRWLELACADELRNALAILLAMRGRYESARDIVAVGTGTGGRVAAATVEHLAGHWDAVEPILREGQDGPAGRAGPGAGLPPGGLNILARSWLARGEIDAADDLLRRGAAHRAPPDPAALADRCGMAARVLAARGEPACALLLAHAAVAAAGLTDSPGCQGLAFLDRAHTYQATGDRRAAHAAAMDARRSFTSKEYLVGVWSTDRLLSAMTG